MVAMLETRNPKKRTGRRPLYGKTERYELRLPERLAERVAYEVNLRNMRDRSTTKWTVSRLVVDELARLYGVEGLEMNGDTESNGRD